MNRSSSAAQNQYKQQPDAPFSEVTSMEPYQRGIASSTLLNTTRSPHQCDGCGVKLHIAHGHGLERKKDGQSSNAMTKSSLSFKTCTQIYPGRSADVEELVDAPTDDRDLLIRNLWKHQIDCILDVRITNFDAPSYTHRKSGAVLLSHERE